MFNPVASGIRPKIVVIAVNKTGFSLASPAFTTRTSAVSLSKSVFLDKFKSSFFLSNKR